MQAHFSVPLVILLGVLAASSNLLGGALALVKPALSEARQLLALGFSGGFLLSVAVLNIMPESLRLSGNAPLLMLSGYFIVYLSEHLFAGHAHGARHEKRGGHHLIGILPCSASRAPIRAAAAAAATTGLILHSFFDGSAITAALASRESLGWLVFFAVVLHKVPEGFSMASISLASGCNRLAALSYAAVLGLSSLLGSVATIAAVRVFSGLEGTVLAVACGMFLHISATDLLPTTSHLRGIRILAVTAAGFATALATSALLHGFLAH